MLMSPSNKDAKRKYFEDQFDDEEVLFVFRRHPIVMRKGLILGLLGPLIGVLPAAINPGLGMGYFFGGLIVGFVLGVIILFPSWVGWYFSVFILTSQRFIQINQKGFFHRSVADINIDQIQSVNYEISGIQETLLGFGTIKLKTYIGDSTIKDIYHPQKIQKKMIATLRDLGVTKQVFPGVRGREEDEEEIEE